MRRRAFIAALGGAAASAAWPLAAHAQQLMPVVGFINSQSPGPNAPYVAAFRQGLKDTGYVEGQNVAIEFRWAEGQNDRVPALTADLVSRPVDVIVAISVPPVEAAKAATTTIPIVFAVGVDPVTFGFVTSLSRPGRNVTGVSFAGPEVNAKRLGLLRDLVPKAAVMAALIDSSTASGENQTRDVQAAARAMGRPILIVNARAEREFDAAFATLVAQRADALLIAPNPVFNNSCEQLSALATRHAIPAISEWRECAAAGGLMSYGTNLADMYRQVGGYVGRILKGAKPADLPVLLPTKFELVINLKTAKALGLDVPSSLQLLADEVIE